MGGTRNKTWTEARAKSGNSWHMVVCDVCTVVWSGSLAWCTPCALKSWYFECPENKLVSKSWVISSSWWEKCWIPTLSQEHWSRCEAGEHPGWTFCCCQFTAWYVYGGTRKPKNLEKTPHRYRENMWTSTWPIIQKQKTEPVLSAVTLCHPIPLLGSQIIFFWCYNIYNKFWCLGIIETGQNGFFFPL